MNKEEIKKRLSEDDAYLDAMAATIIDIFGADEKDIEPLPCPFCGEEHTGMDVTRVNECFVFCVVCGVRGPNTAITEEGAIKAWNNRA